MQRNVEQLKKIILEEKVTQKAKAIKRKLNKFDKLKFKNSCLGKITSQKVK